MAERKIVVPEGMLKAAVSVMERQGIVPRNVGRMLESSLRWLAENPIVPSGEQIESLEQEGRHYRNSVRLGYDWAVVEWQRRMFLAPEPEMIGEETINEFCSRFRTISEAVLEAYRRGQKAGKS